LEPRPPKKLPFCEKSDFGRKKRTFCAKIIFCRKSRFWREKTQILLPKWKKEEKGVQNTKETTGFVVVCAMGPQWSKKSPQNANMRTFPQKSDFARQKRFWRENAKWRKWSPKHLKMTGFNRFCAMGPEMEFLTPKKLIFSKNHTFSRKNANFRNVANFSQKVLQIGFWREKIVWAY